MCEMIYKGHDWCGMGRYNNSVSDSAYDLDVDKIRRTEKTERRAGSEVSKLVARHGVP